jgi:SAM-dependent methyltransferase
MASAIYNHGVSANDQQPPIADQQLQELIELGLKYYGQPRAGYSPDAVTRYYRRSSLAYRLVHSRQEIVHMRIDQDDFQQADAVLGYLPVHGPVVELGCGPGANLAYLQEKIPGGQWAGIDLTPSHIRRARQRCRPDTTLQIGDFCQLPYEDNSCALLYGIEALCHARDYRQALSEAARVLRPGGTLIVFDGWPAAEQSAIQRQAGQLAQKAMAVYHPVPQESWCRAAEQLGLELQRQEDYSQRIRGNTARFARQAQRAISTPWMRRILPLLPPELRSNGLAALLIDPLLAAGALEYGLLVWQRPAG